VSVDEYVLQIVPQHQVAKVSVVVGISEPGIYVACDNDVVVWE
jgi:hypothetical protein